MAEFDQVSLDDLNFHFQAEKALTTRLTHNILHLFTLSMIANLHGREMGTNVRGRETLPWF